MPTYTYPFSEVLSQSSTVTRTRDLTDLYDCADSPFVPCCDCFPVDGQIMYFIPGDVFTYHLPSFTPDSVTAYNFDGTVIGDFNNWINGLVLTVNVDDIPTDIDCFYFSIFSGVERFCFDFGLKRHGTKEVDYCYGGDCGIGTITIESLYTTRDCHGNRYDRPGQPYSNKRRFLADVEYIGNLEEATLVDNIRINTKIYNQYQVKILQPLKQGSKLLDELVEVIMRGRQPIIEIQNGKPESDPIICEDFIDSITKGYENLNDWYPIFTVRTLECDRTLNCN